MIDALQKLLRKEKYPETVSNELTKLKVMRHGKKISHKTYLCKNCGHLYYYAIFRCPLCDSRKIETLNNQNHASEDVVEYE